MGKEKDIESAPGAGNLPISVEEEVSRTPTTTDGQSDKGNATARDDTLMDWDQGLVGFESPEDPENPYNWSKLWHGWMLLYLGVSSTIAPLGSTIVAPAITQTMEEFGVESYVLGTFSVTIYLLGFSIGPLFLGPLTEMYGRYPVYIVSCWIMWAWYIGAGFAPNMDTVIATRFFAGLAGSGSITIAPAITADLYPVEKRIKATAIVTLTQCLGPALGPLVGSFIGDQLGWRWTYWFLLIFSGVTNIFGTFFMQESYVPTLLKRKTARLKKETGRADLRPRLGKNISGWELLRTAIIRPSKMLTTSVITLSICVYVATIYGELYLWFTTIPPVYEKVYGWDNQLTGLAYIGIGLAMVLCLFVIMATNDKTVIRMTKANNGVYEPEFRLPAAMYYAAFVPISLFWYGWSVQAKAHWMVPIIGSSFFGVGMLGIFVPMQQYMVDAFPLYAASAAACVRTSVSVSGAFFPLAGGPLYAKLGYGWGNSLLGFIALALTPIPFLFFKYGKAIRQRWPVEL